MGKKLNVFKDWRLHLTMLVVCTFADKIGNIVIPVTSTIKVILLPILYAMVISTILYKTKAIKWIKEAQCPMGSYMINMSCALLMGLLGISVGKNLPLIIQAGIPMMLQNFGDCLTCVIALPVAVFLGIKREAIGLTFGNSREVLLSCAESKWGADTDEFRGTISMYIVGTIFGAATIGILTSIAPGLGIFSPEAIAMAGGVGALSQSSAAIATFHAMYPPEMADKLIAFCTTSNMLSSAISTYLALFIGMPLTEKLYDMLAKDDKVQETAEEDAK